MEDETVSSLRAVAHPLRLQILSLLTGTELSAAEVARELDINHANASYHLRVLEAAGELEVAAEEKIRGGVAKRYRHPWEGAARTPVKIDDGTPYIRAVGQELERRFRARKKETTSHINDAEMWVTPEVWEQVCLHVREAGRLIHAEAQPPRSPGTLHVNLTSFTFVMEES